MSMIHSELRLMRLGIWLAHEDCVHDASPTSHDVSAVTV